MIKRISKIGAIAMFAVAASPFPTRPLSAQSFTPDGQPSPYALKRNLLAYMDGTREGCLIYSEIAQSQAGDNHYYRCGYSGARWIIDPAHHFWWCRLVRPANIRVELRDREMDLQRCLNRLESEELRRPMAYGR